MFNTSSCRMKPHPRVQLSREKFKLVRRRMQELDPPARLGGWVFLGAIPESYGGQERWVPACLKEGSRKAQVEVLVYAAVRFTSHFCLTVLSD